MLEVLEALDVLDVLDVIRCVLLCMLEGELCLLEVPTVMRCVLGTLYAGRCGGWALFSAFRCGISHYSPPSTTGLDGEQGGPLQQKQLPSKIPSLFPKSKCESMDSSNPSSAVSSKGSTPKLSTSSRFTSQNATAEDLLKSQTIGLVQLSDFRKRRAEALEVKEREGLERSSGRATPASGASTPRDG